MTLPFGASTMGDPAGIGPELIARCLADPPLYACCRPLVVADPAVMRWAVQVAEVDLTVRPARDVMAADLAAPGVMAVLVPEDLALGEVEVGVMAAEYGEAGACCYRAALKLAMAGQVQGVASAPLNKEALHAAGYGFPDELAYAAHLTGSEDTFILGVARGVWTVSVAEHVRFRAIADLVTKKRVLQRIEQMDHVLRQSGVTQPRIAVAALNVHGGEGGVFGDEEMAEIGPAIQEAQARGIHARGPIPADAVFARAFGGDFDAVVCMYHDQANIARKLQPRSEGATVFWGLPVPAATTAHGTAFDIAGKGLADPGSLTVAIRYAAALALGKGRY